MKFLRCEVCPVLNVKLRVLFGMWCCEFWYRGSSISEEPAALFVALKVLNRLGCCQKWHAYSLNTLQIKLAQIIADAVLFFFLCVSLVHVHSHTWHLYKFFIYVLNFLCSDKGNVKLEALITCAGCLRILNEHLAFQLLCFLLFWGGGAGWPPSKQWHCLNMEVVQMRHVDGANRKCAWLQVVLWLCS
jgi:hypothetical protein